MKFLATGIFLNVKTPIFSKIFSYHLSGEPDARFAAICLRRYRDRNTRCFYRTNFSRRYTRHDLGCQWDASDNHEGSGNTWAKLAC